MPVSSGTIRPSVDIATSGIEYFKTAITSSTPGSEQIIISDTVSVGKEVRLLHLHLSYRHTGNFRVLIAGTQVASGKTSPGNPNAFFLWTPYKNATAGQTIEVRFIQITGGPASDVEAYLQGREI